MPDKKKKVKQFQYNVNFPNQAQLDFVRDGLRKMGEATIRSASATARMLLIQGIEDFLEEGEEQKRS